MVERIVAAVYLASAIYAQEFSPFLWRSSTVSSQRFAHRSFVAGELSEECVKFGAKPMEQSVPLHKLCVDSTECHGSNNSKHKDANGVC